MNWYVLYPRDPVAIEFFDYDTEAEVRRAAAKWIGKRKLPAHTQVWPAPENPRELADDPVQMELFRTA